MCITKLLKQSVKLTQSNNISILTKLIVFNLKASSKKTRERWNNFSFALSVQDLLLFNNCRAFFCEKFFQVAMTISQPVIGSSCQLTFMQLINLKLC